MRYPRARDRERKAPSLDRDTDKTRENLKSNVTLLITEGRMMKVLFSVLLALTLTLSMVVTVAYASPVLQPTQSVPPGYMCWAGWPPIPFISQTPCNPNPSGDHGGPPNGHP